MSQALRLVETQRDNALMKLRHARLELAKALERELTQFAIEAALRLQLRVARAQRDALLRRQRADPAAPHIPQQRGRSSGLRPATRPERRIPR